MNNEFRLLLTRVRRSPRMLCLAAVLCTLSTLFNSAPTAAVPAPLVVSAAAVPSAFASGNLLADATAAKAQPDPTTAGGNASSVADQSFLAAREAYRAGDSEHLAALAPALADHPLAPYIQLWQLSLRLRNADSTEDQPRPQAPASTTPLATSGANGEKAATAIDIAVAEFFARYPDTWVADRLRMEWLLALGARHDFDTLLREQPRQIWTHDEQQVRCYAALARYLRDDGSSKYDRARDAARVLASTREAGGDGCMALTTALLDDRMPAASYGWERMRALVEQNQIPAARKIADAVAASIGGVDAASFTQVIDRPAAWLNAHGERVNQAQVELGRIAIARLAREDPEQAARHARILERRLTADQRALMWGRIGHMAAVKLMPEAHEWYRYGGSLVGIAAGTFRGDEVLEWQVRAALRAGTGSSNQPDWRMVRSAIERMTPELQREPAWIYWRARALATEARAPEGNELLRRIAGKFTYYGKLADEALGRPIVIPPRAAPPAAEEVAAFADNAGLARALKFFDLGLRQEGNLEWNWQTRGMSDRQLLALAEFARSRDVTDRMISTSDRTREEFDFTQRFPVPYRDSLARAALAAGVDPAWVYALIRQESRFVVDARSPVGAVGLMQLMPATARYAARRSGTADFVLERLADLETNLRIGTTYLRLVLDDLDGSPVLASAAYNAGPNRPRAWRASLERPVEGAIFIETIPITETRDYVQKVMSNSVYYAALLNDTPPSLRARLGVIAPKPAIASEIP